MSSAPIGLKKASSKEPEAPQSKPASRRSERPGQPVGEPMRGAPIVVESLIAEGVDIIFGYPGGAILHVYDELHKASDRIRHILVRHEQGAAHAAEGYARSTGKVGVCMATSGPGATNLVTGLTNAM